MYYVPLALQCVNGRSDEGGENGVGKEGSKTPREGVRVEIAWPLICR